MRFSKQLLRSATLSVVTIALFAPVLGVASATAADTSRHTNPFRQAQQQASQAATEQVRSIDRQSPKVELETSPADVVVMGTIVPPTEGHFTTNGKRWTFVADYPEFAELVIPKTHRRPVNNTFRTVAASKLHSLARENKLNRTQTPSNPLRSTFDDGLLEPESDYHHGCRFPDQIVIADDLMLQRIIKTIQADPENNRWIVSGHVVHVNGQSQLQIHTFDLIDLSFPF